MADFGSCHCCAEHAMVHVPADSLDGLCGACRARSPEACKRVHRKESAAKTGQASLFDEAS